MSEFNENPFLKDTPVIPFSNGSQFEDWQNHNCNNCVKYESESKKEEDAKCKLAFHLDLGTVIGTIPLWVAKDIGCKYDPLYQYCKLHERCRMFDDGDDSMPF
jgi:hypothetical protein